MSLRLNSVFARTLYDKYLNINYGVNFEIVDKHKLKKIVGAVSGAAPNDEVNRKRRDTPICHNCLLQAVSY
jgi:hypothetical protein